VSQFSTTLLSITWIEFRETAVRIDKENVENSSGVPKDGVVYVPTAERVSKYDKTAAREDSGCYEVREMT
jgi:hypothetical protein